VLLAFRPQVVHDGYGHATIEIWSPTGTLAAVASQTLSLGSVR
jgi:acyl-CoA thioesterase